MYWCGSSEILIWWNSTNINSTLMKQHSKRRFVAREQIFQSWFLKMFHSNLFYILPNFFFRVDTCFSLKRMWILKPYFLLTFFGIKILILLLSSAIFAIIQFMQCMFPTIILWFTFLKWNRSFVFLYQSSNTLE